MNRQRRGRLALTFLTVASAMAFAAGSPPEAPVADAAMRGNMDRVAELLRSGADVNLAQGDGMTALHWASELGDAEMARTLLYAGARVDALTRLGDVTPLHLAAEAGHPEVVEVLVEAGANPVARRRNSGTTPLHFAAAAGSGPSIRALVEAGADVDIREHEWGQTPLMFAAGENRIEALQTLLELGADPSLTTNVVELWRRAEQDRRARAVRDSVFAALRSKAENPVAWVPTPADVQAAAEAAKRYDTLPDEDFRRVDWHQIQLDDNALRFPDLVGYQGGLTALLHAVREGYVEATMLLLDGGADVNQRSAGDLTPPLVMALVNGHFDLGLMLLERGADPNLASDAGATPLYVALNTHWAPKARYPQQRAYLQQDATYLDVMRTLLEAGADPNVRLKKHLWYMEYTFSRLGLDSWGATPFFRAAHALDLEAMELLVEFGAEPGVPTYRPAGPQQYFVDLRAPETEMLDDRSGLPRIPAGGPGVYPIHVATGFGGTGVARASNSQRHVPDGWLPAVRYLVEEHGADVNARDYLGYTPLHWAAARGNNELIRYLLDQGADPHAVSRVGHTVADLANGPVSLGAAPFRETLALLETLGVTPNFDCEYC